MDTRIGALTDSFAQFFTAIDALNSAKLTQPCFVLIYSTIDAAASLDRPKDHSDVTKGDFTAWCDEFLLPSSGLATTALDLYAARCGMLHTFSAFSSLSRSGRVRTLAYAWGAASLDDLRLLIQVRGRRDIVPVHVDTLIRAAKNGFDRFMRSVEADPARAQRVLHNADALFAHVPSLVGKAAADSYRGTTA